MVDVVDWHPALEQCVRLRAIDPPVQKLDVLRLARQHVHEVEPAEIAILQRGELVAEHHRRRCAIAEHQREARVRLGPKRRSDDRHQRRDAAAGRDAEIVSRRLRIMTDAEMAHRRHDVERRAFAQRLVGPHREQATRRAFHRDPQRAARGCADRVRAADVLAADRRSQRQVLAGLEEELLAQLFRHVERDRDRIARLALDLGHRQRMKLAH